jgi:hypothetical protein
LLAVEIDSFFFHFRFCVKDLGAAADHVQTLIIAVQRFGYGAKDLFDEFVSLSAKVFTLLLFCVEEVWSNMIVFVVAIFRNEI